MPRQSNVFRRFGPEQFHHDLGEHLLHLGVECVPDKANSPIRQPDQVVLQML
jgi:hypothetical protein